MQRVALRTDRSCSGAVAAARRCVCARADGPKRGHVRVSVCVSVCECECVSVYVCVCVCVYVCVCVCELV